MKIIRKNDRWRIDQCFNKDREYCFEYTTKARGEKQLENKGCLKVV
jgi:hypothetical protein